jgi:cytochrome d ubiquinol oxidase subunit II
MLRTIAPHWDGNEVWLLTAGGVTFAAFPRVYAVMFSALYTPLLLLLFALILRGVAIEFRHLETGAAWHRLWDTVLCVSSFLPALLLGVAFANLFSGLPIDGDGICHGGLLDLLNPYGLLGGLLFVLLFLLHGSVYLALKLRGPTQQRATALAGRLWPLALVTLAAFVAASLPYTRLFDNYLDQPPLLVLLLVPIVALLLLPRFLARGQSGRALVASAVAIAGAAAFGVIGLFPAMIPSTLGPGFSLTAHNASSSPMTLRIMLGVALVFVPTVIVYQAWAYRLLHAPDGGDTAAYGS